MAKDNSIRIKDWFKGIASSAYFGFQEIRGLNIIDKPGVVYPNLALVKESGSTVDDLVEKFTKASNGDVWGYSEETANSVFKRTSAGAWAKFAGGGSNHGNTAIKGIEFWKGYVAIIHNTTIDWYDISDDSCDTSWGSSDISAGDHPSIHASDDKLYIGAGNVIDSIEEDTDFVPGTGATFTVTKVALDLPEGYTITCLAELGDVLLIGTTKAGNSSVADIFVWDKTSASFDRVIKIRDEGVYEIIVIDNLAYIRAGKKGKWYITNGTTVDFLNGLPTTMLDLTTVNLSVKGQSFNMEDLIYFPVTYNSALEGLGLYSINIKTGKINFEYIISANEVGANDGVWLGGGIALGGSTTNFLLAWNDINGSTFGVDDEGSARYTSDRAFLISQFMSVGTKAFERTFSRPEIKLSKPLASGDSFKVYYRTAQNGSWTSHYTESTVGFQSGTMPSITAVKDIQLKVVLNKNTELFEIILV